jgi:hypothetical protein
MKAILVSVLVSLVACVMFGQTPNQADYQYSAKFVCGTSPTPLAGGVSTLTARGRYFSQTNVHNPSRYQTVSFRKKFAIALPFERPGAVSAYFDVTLQPDQALQIDCGDIFRHLQLPITSYVEGFAVVESPLELDVDTVYTAGAGPAFDVTSIHTERVAERRMQTCKRLDLDLTTGAPGSAWQVVATSQVPPGTLPRAPNTYGQAPFPNAEWIGALQSNITDVKQWWEFQICFCLCTGARDLKLNLTGASIDDLADFTLNGSPIGQLSWSPTGTVTAAALGVINTNAAPFFRAGQNCLKVRLTNVNPTLAGFALAGSVTGADAACPTTP